MRLRLRFSRGASAREVLGHFSQCMQRTLRPSTLTRHYSAYSPDLARVRG